MTTPVRSRKRRKSGISSSRTVKTPKDVRQLDRVEMIEYLHKYDNDISTNIDNLRRSVLQKRVIHCMKQQNTGNVPIGSSINSPQRKKRKLMPQSTIPISKPFHANHNKNNHHHNNNKNYPHINTTQCVQRRVPITKRLLSVIPQEIEYKDQETDNESNDDDDDDICGLKLEWNEDENINTLHETNTVQKCVSNNPSHSVDIDKLFEIVRLGIPARYDLMPLHEPIINLNHQTSYFRSSKIQKMFQMTHMDHELHCFSRTMDDVYQLNNCDLQQIERNVCEWVHKYGEYSSCLHPSIKKTTTNNKLETKDYIFQYEVLGRFVGDEMLENEFYEIYSGVFDEHKRLLHSWIIEINIPIIQNADNDDDKKQITHFEQYEMLIDCLGKNDVKNNNSISDLLLIDDCRNDISKLEMTNDDLKRENVLFITIEINGWPGKFAIAKRDIHENEMLYGHYGDGYNSLKKLVERQQQSVDYFVSSVQTLVKQ